jgi:hypothetical protein
MLISCALQTEFQVWAGRYGRFGDLSDQCENVQALLYVIRILLAGYGLWATLHLRGFVICTHTTPYMRALCLWGLNSVKGSFSTGHI